MKPAIHHIPAEYAAVPMTVNTIQRRWRSLSSPPVPVEAASPKSGDKHPATTSRIAVDSTAWFSQRPLLAGFQQVFGGIESGDRTFNRDNRLHRHGNSIIVVAMWEMIQADAATDESLAALPRTRSPLTGCIVMPLRPEHR